MPGARAPSVGSAADGEELRHGKAVVLVPVDDPPRLGEARVREHAGELVGVPAPRGRDGMVEGERRTGIVDRLEGDEDRSARGDAARPGSALPVGLCHLQDIKTHRDGGLNVRS